MDEEDAVGSESLGKYLACLELPVVRGLTCGMYKSEGLEFVYTVMKHWYYVCKVHNSIAVYAAVVSFIIILCTIEAL